VGQQSAHCACGPSQYTDLASVHFLLTLLICYLFFSCHHRQARVLKQPMSIIVYRLPTKGNQHLFSINHLQKTNRSCSLLLVLFSLYIDIDIYKYIYLSIYLYIYISVSISIYLLLYRYICCHFKWKTENRIPGQFSLIHLPFAHQANRSLLFICLFTKKQMEVICLQTD
jgi:hypothetical protein